MNIGLGPQETSPKLELQVYLACKHPLRVPACKQSSHDLINKDPNFLGLVEPASSIPTYWKYLFFLLNQVHLILYSHNAPNFLLGFIILGENFESLGHKETHAATLIKSTVQTNN